MKNKPKLIFLNGFAGCGKSTIAQLYIDEHPLALALEGDDIITQLGQWRTHLDEAVRCKLALTECMVTTHLQNGYDVILPLLLLDPTHAQRYQSIAQETGACFFEVVLSLSKEEAITRLMKRGTWGEKGLPPLTENDRPKIEALYNAMTEATRARPGTIALYPKENEIRETCDALLAIVDQQ
jgi:predicted kinase